MTADVVIVSGERFPSIEIIWEKHPPFAFPPGVDGTVDIYVLVTDSLGQGVPNYPVSLRIEAYQGGSSFGRIDYHDSTGVTDENGLIRFTFHTEGKFGKFFYVFGFGEVGDHIEDEVLITVIPITTGLRLTLAAKPDSLALAPDSVGMSLISAMLLDSLGYAAPNMEINFRTDLGSLANVTLTDSAGTATVEFYILPETDFPSPDSTEATATITARVGYSDLSDTLRVRVWKVE